MLEDMEDIKAAKEVEHEEDIPWEEVKKKLDKKNNKPQRGFMSVEEKFNRHTNNSVGVEC